MRILNKFGIEGGGELEGEEREGKCLRPRKYIRVSHYYN